MVSEEAIIISGLLVGLNSFDVTIDLKSDLHDFDSPVNFFNINSKIQTNNNFIKQI